MMTVPPASISRSAARPIVGLQLRPDVVSDPPHSTPMIRSDIGHGSRLNCEACSTMRAALRVPCATHSMVPFGCR